MPEIVTWFCTEIVVPRKGDVDRNHDGAGNRIGQRVVPRKGDVDRNARYLKAGLAVFVVPRKGDVDRNAPPYPARPGAPGRPPQGGRG